MKRWYMKVPTAIPSWAFRVEEVRVGNCTVVALFVFNRMVYRDIGTARSL